MKVKYIIGAVLILALGYEIYRIEKQLSVVTLEIRKTDRATITIPAMTEASTFDTTDLFIVADGGTVTRKMLGRKITGAIGDSVQALRGELQSGDIGVNIFIGDTLASTTKYTEWFSIHSNLNGYNLSHIEVAAATSVGTCTVAVNMYRRRGGDTVTMTSTAASLDDPAVINTSNDDVQTGDDYRLSITLGSGTPPVGVNALIVFHKP